MLEIQVSCYPWVLFLYWLFGLSFSDRVSLTLIYQELTEPSASDFTVVGLKVGGLLYSAIPCPQMHCLSLDFQDSFSM